MLCEVKYIFKYNIEKILSFLNSSRRRLEECDEHAFIKHPVVEPHPTKQTYACIFI